MIDMTTGTKSVIKIVFIFSVFVFSPTYALNITTWNLEHFQDKESHEQWKEFMRGYDNCEAANQERPSSMTYCGALDGESWSIRPKSCDFVKGKSVLEQGGYQEKVNAIRSRLISLNSDVYAFQELNSGKALEELFESIQGYELFYSKSELSNLHMGYAIKSELKPKFQQNNDFIVNTCDVPLANSDCRKHLTRPGLEAVIKTSKGEVTLLNVHLKSGCQTYALNNIFEKDIKEHLCEDFSKRKKRILGGCLTLRKQVPILENWIEKQTISENRFIVLGDFNRKSWLDLRHKARLDDTDKTSVINSETRIGSLIKEISDNQPKGASIVLAKSEVDAIDTGGYKSCWDGIDWIALSQSFANEYGWSIQNKPLATGADFRPYNSSKVIASDHCPITLKLPDTSKEE